MQMGFWATAVYVVLTFTGYLRPSETLRLRRKDLVCPMPGTRCRHWSVVLHAQQHQVPSKTLAYNEVVPMDLEEFAFLDPALQYLLDATPVGGHLFAFTLEEAATRFRLACKQAQLEGLAPMLYQLHHSGPSADLALRRRSLAAVKLRGRWATDRSMARYLKEGRVGQ